jgi:hypothetical protein
MNELLALAVSIAILIPAALFVYIFESGRPVCAHCGRPHPHERCSPLPRKGPANV